MERNEKLVTEVTYGLDKKFWWVCKNGHHYQAIIINRSYGKHGCPICALRFKSSFAEQSIYYYLSYIFYGVKSSVKLFDFEYDVALPDERILIEFNGAYWHENTANRDWLKRHIAVTNGYKFIVVRALRDDQELSVSDRGCYVEISCKSERTDKSSIDRMVRSVITCVFSFLSRDVPDLDFVNSSRDEDTILKLWRGELELDTSGGSYEP